MSRESKFQTILIHFWLCVCHILRSTWLCHSHLHVRPAAHWRPALPHVGLAADEEATERMRKGWQIRTNHDKSAKTLITIPKPNKTWRVVTLSSKQVLKLPRSTESLGISERILYNILYWFRLGTSSSSTGLVTYLSENFFASWSWSRGVWTQNTSGRRRSCALSQKRKRSESWSILSWYSSPLSSGTWHQSGWSSAMQSSIFAHLGTSWHIFLHLYTGLYIALSTSNLFWMPLWYILRNRMHIFMSWHVEARWSTSSLGLSRSSS